MTVQLDTTGIMYPYLQDVNNGSTEYCGISLVELIKTSLHKSIVGLIIRLPLKNGNVAN
jgi:hypothetical protein